jgi:hypothetical protein
VSAHRYRAIGVEERGGRRVAVVDDRRGTAQRPPGPVRVFHRLGRWRFYADDRPVADPALAACARRAIAADSQRRHGDAARPEEPQPEVSRHQTPDAGDRLFL